MWKILLLYYGLFDHHSFAAGRHLSSEEKETSFKDLQGIVQHNLKNCQLEEWNEEEAQVLFLPQHCISDPWVCKWTEEAYKQRISLQLTKPFDCGQRGKIPWNDLPQEVHFSFISINTCLIVWRAEDHICRISIPKWEMVYTFVGGGPRFLGIADIDPAGCRWETTLFHCHPAATTDEEGGKYMRSLSLGRQRRFPGKRSHKIKTKIEHLPQELECTWNTDVMQPQFLSVVVRNHYICPDPGEGLGHPVHVQLSYDGSCAMLLEYQTTSCFLEVPNKKSWHAFLYGDSHAYPYLISILDKEKDECIWQQNLMQC